MYFVLVSHCTRFLCQDITENYLLEQELKKYQSELEEKIKGTFLVRVLII